MSMKWLSTFCGASLIAALTLGQGAQAQTAGEFEMAIKQNYASAIKAMLAKGFDPNTSVAHGQPGLVLALREGTLDAAKAILASPRLKVNQANAEGETALMMAAFTGQMDIAKQLVAKGAIIDGTGWTPLHYAATKGQMDMIRYLLRLGADIDAGSPNGSTPLMMAAGYGSPEAVKLLIESGADLDKRNQVGLSALDFAKRYERPDAITLLTQAERFKAQGRVWQRRAVIPDIPASSDEAEPAVPASSSEQ